jgi:hypothetical protein
LIDNHCWFLKKKIICKVWVLFCFCFESHEQFFSYLATVTITGDRAANVDLCLALTAFSSEGSFTCHTYCDTGPPFLRSYPKDPWFSLLNAFLLAKEESKFINSSQNEGLSPSCIALSFDGFGSISWLSIWFFRPLYSFHIFSRISKFFGLSTTK